MQYTFKINHTNNYITMNTNSEETKVPELKSNYLKMKRKPVLTKNGHYVTMSELILVDKEYDYEKTENTIDFPISIFPKHIQDYINKLHATLKYDISVTSASILFAVATAVGNQKKIQVKLKWETNPNLWIAVVGRKGTAKSHMMKAAIDPLIKADKVSNEAYKNDLKIWNSLNVEERAAKEAPTKKKFLTNDVTVEGLLKTLERNPKGLGLFKDELRGFFEDMTRYSSNSIGFWLSVFNGGSWEKERVNAETPSVDDICISILGSIQPGVLNKLASNNTENGMIDRWLYVPSNNKICSKTLEDITEEEEHSYDVFINDILKRLDDERFIKWGNNAKDEWLLSSNNLTTLIDDDGFSIQLQEYFSKLDAYLPRFILLIALMNGSNTVEVTHVKKAMDLVIYFIMSANNIFTGFENTTTIQSIFDSSKAKNKQDKAKALLTHMPNMTKKEIAKEIGCTVDTVYKAEEKLHKP